MIVVMAAGFCMVLLAGCPEGLLETSKAAYAFADVNADGVCDTCCQAGDVDGDGVCDNFLDADGDGLCDNRQSHKRLGLGAPGYQFRDGNGDGQCDLCDGRDLDGDGVCDNFADEDGDGLCDNNLAHTRFGWGPQGYAFQDGDGDGICDRCGGQDGDLDGVCDNFGDADGDGLCDNRVSHEQRGNGHNGNGNGGGGQR